MNLPAELKNALSKLSGDLSGELHLDAGTRGIYATDASNHQIIPLAVALPKNPNDVHRILEFARDHKTPLLPRGGGTSLAGQTVGRAIIIDFSKYLSGIIELNTSEKWVRVEPGIVLDELNAILKNDGLIFPPDPATSSRANVGGMIANNSSGTKSILYGKTSDHVLELEVLLPNGKTIITKAMSPADFRAKAEMNTQEGKLYAGVCEVIDEQGAEIEARFPKTMRRVGGYALDAFLEEQWDLGRLITGSEGTLGIVLAAKLNLVDLPKCKGVSVVHFSHFRDAILAVAPMLEFSPAAVEILDHDLLAYARKNIETRALCDFIIGDPRTLQVVEFYGDTTEEIETRAKSMEALLREQDFGYAYPFFHEGPDYRNVWEMRKKGLGLLMGEPNARKPLAFIEDAAIPQEHLPDYIEDVLAVCKKYDTRAAAYAHASVGVIHVRPFLDLRDPEDIGRMRKISRESFELVRKYQGSWSSEHGDGFTRGEYLEEFYGPKIYDAFRAIKHLFDPENLLNPGKIIDAELLDENLRYGPDYRDDAIDTVYKYRDQFDFQTAVHQCTGIGACRKLNGGTMCPSFMVTRDEEHSTRGRANMLRMAMSGQLDADGLESARLRAAMDLCISCKACKAECPSSVDMSRLKSEVLNVHYRKQSPALREKLVRGSARMAQRVSGWKASLVNGIMQSALFRRGMERIAGVDRRRKLPEYAALSFAAWFRKHYHAPENPSETVVLFADTYLNYHEPQIGVATVKLLQALKIGVVLADVGCCQRPRISNGFLDLAKQSGADMAYALAGQAADEVPILVLEPSCASALKYDLPDMLDHQGHATMLERRVMLLEDFLIEKLDKIRALTAEMNDTIVAHGHCHQKALFSTSAALEILKVCTNADINELNSGCCGMAGAFGYEKEHYEISRRMADRVLIPAVDSAEENAVVIANGFSCRHQISDFTGRKAVHWIQYLAETLK